MRVGIVESVRVALVMGSSEDTAANQPVVRLPFDGSMGRVLMTNAEVQTTAQGNDTAPPENAWQKVR